MKILVGVSMVLALCSCGNTEKDIDTKTEVSENSEVNTVEEKTPEYLDMERECYEVIEECISKVRDQMKKPGTFSVDDVVVLKDIDDGSISIYAEYSAENDYGNSITGYIGGGYKNGECYAVVRNNADDYNYFSKFATGRGGESITDEGNGVYSYMSKSGDKIKAFRVDLNDYAQQGYLYSNGSR